jgi:hypothetical protein
MTRFSDAGMPLEKRFADISPLAKTPTLCGRFAFWSSAEPWAVQPAALCCPEARSAKARIRLKGGQVT